MRKCVLIVEDDNLARQSLVANLEPLKIKVLEAKDGLEGLTAVKRHQPDLVVADIHMPGMDGLEMISQMRKQPWGKEIPVIIMTTDNTSETLYDALKGGVSVYLSKTSLSVDAFAAQIKQALGL